MLLVLFKAIFLLACLLAFMPIVYAEQSLSLAESAPLFFVGQNNLSEQLPIDRTKINQGPTMTLAPKPEDRYFDSWDKEAAQDILYEQRNIRFKSEIVDDEKYTKDRETMREEWRDLLGFDLFYLYFKAKDAEKWVKNKFSVKLFNIKGSPQFNKHRILYVFKATF